MAEVHFELVPDPCPVLAPGPVLFSLPSVPWLFSKAAPAKGGLHHSLLIQPWVNTNLFPYTNLNY